MNTDKVETPKVAAKPEKKDTSVPKEEHKQAIKATASSTSLEEVPL